jgi:hypothetical protein
MIAPAAFQGSYTDIRFVKTRKVCQITVELPIEAGAAFIAAFGTPNPATDCPVALARIDLSAKPAKAISAPEQSNVEPIKRRKFADLRPSTQAGIVCGEAAFSKYMEEQHPDSRGFGRAEFVRHICGVKSRTEFDTDPEAANRWRLLLSSYLTWRGVLV